MCGGPCPKPGPVVTKTDRIGWAAADRRIDPSPRPASELEAATQDVSSDPPGAHGANWGRNLTLVERGPDRYARVERAKAICVECPVIDSCRLHALAVQEQYGVWGGLSEEERLILLNRSRRRGRRVEAPIDGANH